MITYQSKLFGQTRKQPPKDEVSVNAQLLIRAGFIEKNLSGVYTYLPLGLRVLRKIEAIIRQAMNELGAQELLLPTLQNKEVWQVSGRWQNRVGGSMYQFKDSSGKELGLAPTHEEQITDIIRKQVKSYKDLPFYLYQIQNKFRDEPRAKSGLIRGREFLMKDLYSFTQSAEETQVFYKQVIASYLEIFNQLGLEAFLVEASGGSMSKKHSHEFMVATEAGEDVTLLCSHCHWAQNQEIAAVQEGQPCPKCGRPVKKMKTVEAGNIFDQETVYTKPFKAFFTDRDGQSKLIQMGAYGLGLGRAMGTIVEASHDDRGIIWTKKSAPFDTHLILLSDNNKVQSARQTVIKELSKLYDILVDDRELSVGQKLTDADLIGIPLQIIIGERNLPELEVKTRFNNKVNKIKIKELAKVMTGFYADKAVR